MIKKRKKFTLIELIVVFVVFIILVSAIMEIFNSISRNLRIADANRNIYERARLAFDIMGRDIQCAYYGDETVPFWHHSSVSGWNEYSNELLAFVATTPFPPETYSSDLFEIKYQLYYTDNPAEDTAGWIVRSVTSNLTDPTTTNPKWNFSSNFSTGYTTDSISPISAFTADNTSSDSYTKLIPYVTRLEFTCYDKNGDELSSDNTTSTVADECADATNFPYYVRIMISLLDRISWTKWINAGGTLHDLDNDPAEAIRKKNERTFKQDILIGNRGQCND
jgi:type II secretory pathway pseudopilin PulG